MSDHPLPTIINQGIIIHLLRQLTAVALIVTIVLAHPPVVIDPAHLIKAVVADKDIDLDRHHIVVAGAAMR